MATVKYNLCRSLQNTLDDLSLLVANVLGQKNELWWTILDDSSTIVKCVGDTFTRIGQIIREKNLTEYLVIHIKLLRYPTVSPNDSST